MCVSAHVQGMGHTACQSSSVCVCIYIYVCARARIRAPLMSPGGREVSLTRDAGSLGRSLDS